MSLNWSLDKFIKNQILKIKNDQRYNGNNSWKCWVYDLLLIGSKSISAKNKKG